MVVLFYCEVLFLLFFLGYVCFDALLKPLKSCKLFWDHQEFTLNDKLQCKKEFNKCKSIVIEF